MGSNPAVDADSLKDFHDFTILVRSCLALRILLGRPSSGGSVGETKDQPRVNATVALIHVDRDSAAWGVRVFDSGPGALGYCGLDAAVRPCFVFL